MTKKTALVVSAHAADFVWRAGGAIALHQAKGYGVKVVCLTYGERGESAKIWKEPGETLEKVKAVRRVEAEQAAKALDARHRVLRPRGLSAARWTGKRSSVSSTYPQGPAGVHDEPPACGPLQHRPHVRDQDRARVPDDRPGRGHNPHEKAIGAPQLYLFEPHQTEQMNWKPDVFLDITEVLDKKSPPSSAWSPRSTSGTITPTCPDRAQPLQAQSGGQPGGRNAKYAEGFQWMFPRTVDGL